MADEKPQVKKEEASSVSILMQSIHPPTQLLYSWCSKKNIKSIFVGNFYL